MKTSENKKQSNFLVVGADGFLGSRLVSQLIQQGHNVTGTTRRRGAVAPDRVFLDLNEPENFKISDNVECVFILAGITNYGHCETDPDAWKVNVEGIPYLASCFLKAGVFVIFISTNSVFGGDQPWPGEDDPHHPKIAYSRQKSASEVAIRSQAEKLDRLELLSIVRLTKILAASTSPFPQWFAAWKSAQVVTPFSDLIFAPISLDFAAKKLGVLGESPVPGNLHLSGEDNITYFDFAKAVGKRMGVPDSLIEPTTSVEMGVKVLFLPQYSGISMKRTSELTGIFPESLESVAAFVVDGVSELSLK
tara:strand:+ start:127 stop:1044 length:918 start_codon:yes stop_codon:yes gene_type:complete